MNTVTITPKLHEAILAAADIVEDTIAATDESKFPYAAESLGDVRDLLLMLANARTAVFE
jgi:hypothetical protein